MRLDEGKGGGHSHAILSAFKGEIIIVVLKGPVDSMFHNYLHCNSIHDIVMFWPYTARGEGV